MHPDEEDEDLSLRADTYQMPRLWPKLLAVVVLLLVLLAGSFVLGFISLRRAYCFEFTDVNTKTQTIKIQTPGIRAYACRR